ncbi:uncharacterized protein LOC134834954 [Culicoides brevitarsis]|uniref:uncharacterized protein LOC134834954 n=1 Tax=Culicoides brevitarsis TaxID=469753 RepID=UPI00307B6C11
MKYFLIFFCVVGLTAALNPDEAEAPEVVPDVSEQPILLSDVVESGNLVIRRRNENCKFVYKPVYPVFCHPMAPRDEEGKCRKIVSLQLVGCGEETTPKTADESTESEENEIRNDQK